MTVHADVYLRPVAESDLVYLEQIDTDPALSEPFEWRGFADPTRHRERLKDDGYLGSSDSMLVVSLPADRLAGIVTWRPAARGSRPSCLVIGILLHPDHRGTGIGTVAQQLLAAYLFDTTPVHRIEATTEANNIAEQRALEKAGFHKEGILRGRGFVRGEWQDGIMYSRLRSDPPPS